MFEPIKLGVTGTQFGMTEYQMCELMDYLKTCEVSEFHHGDCVGADEEAVYLARQYTSAKIISHPPIKLAKRAYAKSDIVLKPKEYLKRNHDIVKACDLLLAFPKFRMEQKRSGTWATIRFARKVDRELRIFYPHD